MRNKYLRLSILLILICTSCTSLRLFHKNDACKKNSIERSPIGRVIFADDFSDNNKKWNQISNKEFQLVVTDGYLRIDKYNRNRVSNGCLWYKKAIDSLDTSRDFSISFDARFIKGDDVAYSMDFEWGNLNDDFYQLNISPNGTVRLNRYSRLQKSRWSYLISKYSQLIRKGTQYNRVTIRQQLDNCKIVINDKLVIKYNVDRIPGNCIGFLDCLKVTWDMDNLEIRQ
jgi:hypothetical protein